MVVKHLLLGPEDLTVEVVLNKVVDVVTMVLTVLVIEDLFLEVANIAAKAVVDKADLLLEAAGTTAKAVVDKTALLLEAAGMLAKAVVDNVDLLLEVVDMTAKAVVYKANLLTSSVAAIVAVVVVKALLLEPADIITQSTLDKIADVMTRLVIVVAVEDLLPAPADTTAQLILDQKMDVVTLVMTVMVVKVMAVKTSPGQPSYIEPPMKISFADSNDPSLNPANLKHTALRRQICRRQISKLYQYPNHPFHLDQLMVPKVAQFCSARIIFTCYRVPIKRSTNTVLVSMIVYPGREFLLASVAVF